MSLVLVVLTSAGIIFTADSRQTYANNVGMVRIGSDNAVKLFKLTDRVAVGIAGRAFLPDSDGTLKTVGSFVEAFKDAELKTQSKVTTKEIAERLNRYLAGLFVEKEMESLRQQTIPEAVKKAGGTNLAFKAEAGNLQPYTYTDSTGKVVEDNGRIESIDFIVAGFDNNRVGHAYATHVPSGVYNNKDTKTCGAVWIGQTDVLSRIIKGYDPEIGALSFVKEALAQAPDNTKQELNKLEYIVNWGTMTLQDAADFAVLVTRTTENIQRFSDGTSISPGGITGVGGDVTVAAITADRGVVWVKKKNLSAEGSVVDMDAK
jgi:20S proteasome alpha/beta subunit